MFFHYNPSNFRGIIIVLMGLIIFTFVFLKNNTKSKNDYESVTGRITYLKHNLNENKVRDSVKYRYLKVEGYKYPFEVFIGKDFGDFKPKFEHIDGLKVGDSVSVFYYENWSTTEDGVNRFLQYVDKGDQPFFVRGNGTSILGVFMLFSCILFIAIAYLLLKKKKIKF